ncbi:MAG: efflux RND transporter permease subunit, partial [Candidatus Eisenbacteria bacterium]|nr:efflux RND transporter permease subunit [Candidatus Eisenbacteria bacterium]
VKGIAAAQIKGGLEEEIQIDVDQERLAALGIPLDRIAQVVGVSNVNLPGGSLRSVDSQFLIRTLNEFDDLAEIENLIIRQDEGAPVRLADVAEVYRGAKEREEITRVGGRECVQVDIFKEGDANTVAVARVTQEKLAEIRDDLPPGYELVTLFDQSLFIQQAIQEVRNAALIGGLLAIIILFVFLRDFRSTLIIATSIPISIVATFMLMYRMDISLNIMSLGGLTLGIGMLVDNSIVVLESIFRKRKEGMSLAKSAVNGTDEVGPAVIASTLTTVAVFLPIVFVEGVAGQLFNDQALTVTLSLLASLLVAITVIPMLSAVGGGGKGKVRSEEEPGKQALGSVSRAYDRFIRGAIRLKWGTVFVAAALFVASVFALRLVGTELIPPMSQGEFFFEVKMPEGTALNATNRVITEMEEAVDTHGAIDRHYATVGSRLVSGGLSLNTKGENLGQLNLVLKDKNDSVHEQVVMEELRDTFSGIPEVELKSGKPSYFSLKTPVEVLLFGEDLEQLRDYSLVLAEEVAGLPGLVDVRSSLESGNPEVQVIFDRDRLASLGLDMGVLSETLKNRVLGAVPTRYKEADRQIDIRVRNRESDRASVDDVRNLVVEGPDGRPIRLLSLADVQLDRGPAEVHRLKQQRAAVISANLEGITLGKAVGLVDQALAASPPPPGISTEIGGQNKEMQVSFNSLRFAIGLAIFLVYLVMAAVFESLVHPFIVLFTIPLALVGVAAGLLATQTPISVIVLIGTIMLVGIVVNNAIVLIDTINRYRRSGMDKLEAVVSAGHVRLRPILMTTLTTILGLLPMALAWGEGSELRTPLAVTVASGLFLSTLLTLIVIPAAYMIVPSKVSSLDIESLE